MFADTVNNKHKPVQPASNNHILYLSTTNKNQTVTATCQKVFTGISPEHLKTMNFPQAVVAENIQGQNTFHHITNKSLSHCNDTCR